MGDHIPPGVVLGDDGTWRTADGHPYLTREQLAAVLGATEAQQRQWSHTFGSDSRLPYPDHDPAVGLRVGRRRLLPVAALVAWREALALRAAAGRRAGLERARAVLAVRRAAGAAWEESQRPQ